MKRLGIKSKIGLLISFIVVLGIYNVYSSKRSVHSPAYNTMLKGMLSETIPVKSVGEIDKLIKSQTTTVLDTREKAEYEVSHLKNSIWVGYDDFELKRVSALDLTDTIVVYCSVGYRSEKVAEKLQKAGFKHIINMYGGVFEWVNQGFPVYTSSGTKTQKVHAYSKTWGVWLKKGEKVY